MKKLFVFASLLMAATALHAQQPTTHFGIKGGLNLANLEIEDNADGDHRTGFHVGGLAHIHISRQFAIQPELVFSLQGREQTIGGTEYRTNLSYINLPVLAQYMIGTGFRLQTGPQLGFLVNAESKVNNVESDVKDNFNTLDFSWSFGASYLTNVGLGFDARYNLGINNIYEPGNSDVMNRVWQIGLFYQFMHNPTHRKK